jgi:GT2 family glycosyltransferase
MPVREQFSNNQPFVSIIIPVFQQWDQALLAIDALSIQTYPQNRFEILIVNNEPTGKFPVQFQPLQNLRLIHEPLPGSYSARNTGISSSIGEVLGFMDADCLPDSNWIAKAISSLLSHPNISRIAGSIEILFNDPRRRSPVELWISLFAWRQELAASRGTALTGNLFAYRSVFEKVGFFDQSLKSGGDTEWGLRANKAGFPILYAPEVRVLHPARTNWRELYHRIIRLYGGTWDVVQNQTKEKRNFLRRLGNFRIGTDMLHTTLTTGKLTSFMDRLKVLSVIVFVGLVRLGEHIRLMLGGAPRRN